VCSAFQSGERVPSLDTPRSRSFRSYPRYHLLDFFASWQGVNRETDERGRGLAGPGLWEDTDLTGAKRAYHSLFFIQIFLGNIILQYLMRANLLLVSVTSVFDARHCVGLERVSFLDQLGHTLRIRTFDVGQSL